MTYTVLDIERAVCQRFNVSRDELRSQSRCRYVTRPRQIAMYLAREMTGASLPLIGAVLGGRDHTTVLYGQRRIDRLMRESNELLCHIQDVREILAKSQTHRQRIGEAIRETGSTHENRP